MAIQTSYYARYTDALERQAINTTASDEDPEYPASNIDSEDQFSASLAAGVKLRFNQNLGLRLEGRGYWTNLDTEFRDDGFGCRRRRCDRVDEALYQLEGNVGLIFAF